MRGSSCSADFWIRTRGVAELCRGAYETSYLAVAEQVVRGDIHKIDIGLNSLDDVYF